MHAYDGEAPQALIVTGVGVVSGREVMITAGDSSLKGGSWYPLSVKKIVRAQEIALREPPAGRSTWSTPAARSCRCRDEIYALGGYIFAHQCLMSGAGIPQLALVLGHLHRGRRLPADALRPVDHGARHRLRVPRRPAAGQGGDRRGRERRGSRRRRHAHLASRAPATTRSTPRRRVSSCAARSSAPGAARTRPRSTGASPSRPTTTRTSSTGSSPTTSRSSSTSAR